MDGCMDGWGIFEMTTDGGERISLNKNKKKNQEVNKIILGLHLSLCACVLLLSGRLRYVGQRERERELMGIDQ